MEIDTTIVAAVLVGCLVGGFVKGASGSGLPQIAVPVIALFANVPVAMALVQLPALSINIAQVRVRDHPPSTVLRHWPVVLALGCATVVGVSLLRIAPPAFLFALMAGVTISTVLFLWLKPNFSLPPSMRLKIGVPLALTAGLSAGMSSLGGPFMVPYFLSLQLPKNVFVSTVSLCYMAVILPTIGFFLYWGLVDPRLFVYSIGAVIPSLAGMWAGTKFRDRINDRQFRNVVLLIQLVSAAGLIVKAVSVQG